MKYKCTMTNCTMNQGGNCHLGATQVYTLGCQKYIEKVSQTVSFAEAWKAYEEGKRIKSVNWSETEMKLPYIRNSHEKHCHVSLRASEIRGQWIILED